MAYASSSEDDFPDVEVIVRRQKQNITGHEPSGDKGNAPRQPASAGPAPRNPDGSIEKTPATTRRIRKLGPGQPMMDGSLLQPWQRSNGGGGAASRASGPKQASRAQTARLETCSAPAGELLDRLPVKAKRVESRAVSSVTAPDSPPAEQKRTRRLISRGEKKALELKVSLEEESEVESSDESELDTESCDSSDVSLPSGEDEESDFISGGGSDSDDLSMPPPQRSRSPVAPRRIRRRVLSSISDPAKKEPAKAKTVCDDSITSPRKQPAKQNPPKVSTTGQLKVPPKKKLEDVFEKLKIFDEDSDPEKSAARDKKAPILEPTTPRKQLTAAPAKAPRIPMSPWKPEHREFWDPEVNFAWIDQHSPPKKKKNAAPPPMMDATAPEHREELRRRYGTSPEKKQARRAFDAVKEALARDFLVELDEVVTGGELARLTEATGGLRVVWSNTLLTTAGRANWKCKTTTTISKPSGPSSSSASSSSRGTTAISTTRATATQHYASIELATKVLSNEADLLNTVAHEFCHLAVFLLHGKPKLAHGAEFKAYGRRVMSAASSSASGGTTTTTTNTKKGAAAAAAAVATATGALRTPRARGVDINVTTRHSYEIEYPYVWRCADCATEVGRHSRSVDPQRHRCGRCKKGVLVQVKPVPRGKAGKAAGGGGEDAGAGTGKEGPQKREGGEGKKEGEGEEKMKKKKKTTAYQEFTSREMKALSVSHKGLSFKEKMAVVSARWGEHQKLAKAKLAETETPPASLVGVKALAAAVGVLEIEDDDSSDGGGAGA
ncbi:hypothetical protein F4802DRAFT_264074 [Xylaria palmicola]|nr:hypothetical protein F4802DRAFT_264074 [Xylaria palmicola]